MESRMRKVGVVFGVLAAATAGAGLWRTIAAAAESRSTRPVMVQLVYDDGGPLTGAEVRLVRSVAALRRENVARRRRSALGEPATLDHEGRAVVALDGDEPFKLDVRLPDSWRTFRTPPITPAGGRARCVLRRMFPHADEWLPTRVRLIDGDGRPMPGVAVYLKKRGGCIPEECVAGHDGWFELQMFGEVDVESPWVRDTETFGYRKPYAVVAGRGDVRWDYFDGGRWPALVLTAGGTAEVVLREPPLVAGKVVGADGRAISGAEVLVTAPMPPPFGDVFLTSTATREDGAFLVEVEREGLGLGSERPPQFRLAVVGTGRSAVVTLPSRVRGKYDLGTIRLDEPADVVPDTGGPCGFGGPPPNVEWRRRNESEFAWAAKLDAALRTPARHFEAPDTLSADEGDPDAVVVAVSAHDADGEPVSAEVRIRRGRLSAHLSADATIVVAPGPLEIEARRGAVVARRVVDVHEDTKVAVTLPPTRFVHLVDDAAQPEDFAASTTATVYGLHAPTWPTDVWPGVCISTEAPVDAPVTFVVDRLGDRCTVTAPPGVDVVEAPKRPFGRLHVKVDPFAYARRLLLAVARADDPEASARTFGDFEIHAGACEPWAPIALAPGRYLVAMLDVTWLLRAAPGSDCGGLIAVREVVVRDGATVEAAF